MMRNCSLRSRCATLASLTVTRLSTQSTSQPLASSLSHKCDPRNPAPPVITARKVLASTFRLRLRLRGELQIPSAPGDIVFRAANHGKEISEEGFFVPMESGRQTSEFRRTKGRSLALHLLP